MQMINAFEGASAAQSLPTDLKERIARRSRLLGPAYRLFYREPLHIVRGAGVWLYDVQGRKYLDAYNNVPVVGHCHQEVVAALTNQAAILNTHTRYVHDAVLNYAENLLQHFPQELSHVMFTCTGSEANDLGMRIAKHSTGGTGFVVSSFAYHGATEAVSALSPSLGYNLGPAPAHVRLVPPPDAYRGSSDVGQAFAAGVKAAVDDLAKHGHRVAGLLFDTVFSSDGILTHPIGMIDAAVDVVRAAGGLYMADEVQAGFARTGETFWGFQRHGRIPDIVSMGKPMGNGHPIAGLVMRPDIVAGFAKASRYFNTFGGNPVSSQVAQAVLTVIERDGLQAQVTQVGAYLVQRLKQLATRNECIGDVRGAGLYIGVDMVKDRQSKTPSPQIADAVVNGLRERGVLISACGAGANVLKIRPPLVFENKHVDILLDTLDETLASVAN